jgi:hypothetical protein
MGEHRIRATPERGVERGGLVRAVVPAYDDCANMFVLGLM